MSILKSLLLEGDVYNYRLDLESIEDPISLEGVKEKLKDILQKIIEKIKAFFKFIREKFSKWLNEVKRKAVVKVLEKEIKMGYLTDAELRQVTVDFFTEYKPTRLLTDPYYILDKDGRIIDVNDLVDKTSVKVEQLLSYIGDSNPDISNKFVNIGDEMEDYDYEFAVYSIKNAIRDMDVSTTKRMKIDKNNILHSVKTFHTGLDAADKFYKKYEVALTSKLKELEVNNSPNDDLTKRDIHILKIAIKIAQYPKVSILQLVRYYEFIAKKINSLEYTSTAIEPAKPIYHLSDRDDLELLKPRREGSNLNEFLPPRVSFAPSVKQCIIGIPNHFNHDKSANHDEIETKTINVYEGIQVKGKTRYLKKELVNVAMHGTIQHRMQEVCVATPIKVKLIGKIEVTYRIKYYSFQKEFLVSLKKLY